MPGILRKQKKNILFFSSSLDLGETLKEWTFSHFGVFDQEQKCQWCGTKIMNFVAIRNVKNKTCCLIGRDCYERLRRGGQSDWPSLMEQKKRLKKELQVNIGGSGGKTTPIFLRWFDQRLNLPVSLKEVVEQTKSLGFPPSETAVQKLRKYFQNFRLFLPSELLDFNAQREVRILGSWGYPRPLPQKISLRGLKSLENWLRRRKKSLAASFLIKDFGQAFWPLDGAFISRQHRWNHDAEQDCFVLHNKVNGRWISLELDDFQTGFDLASFWSEVSAEDQKIKTAWQETAPAELEVWGFDPRYPLNWRITSNELSLWIGRARDYLTGRVVTADSN